MRRWRIAVSVVGLLMLASCADGPTGLFGAPNGYEVRVLDGGTSVDTVMADAGVLEVRVFDRYGLPVRDALVRFLAQPPVEGDSSAVHRAVYVCATFRDECFFSFDEFFNSVQVEYSERTDSTGRATARLQHGSIASHARVHVFLPELGGGLMVAFATKPGQLAQVRASVADTAIYVGRSYEILGHPADRFGNRRPGTATMESIDPAVVTLSSGVVTANAIGRGLIRMTAGGVIDTAFVSVPPVGRLLVTAPTGNPADPTSFLLVNTDGSARRALNAPGAFDNAVPAWIPGTSKFLYQRQIGEEPVPRLWIADTAGPGPSLFIPTTFGKSMQAVFSATESNLYFYGTSATGPGDGVWTAEADGSGAVFRVVGTQPAPAPDGSKIAYNSNDALMVLDVAGDSSIAVGSCLTYPRWSPGEDLIAFHHCSNEIRGVKSDGTGMRTISAGNNGSLVTWSPDGQWLVVAKSTAGGPFEIFGVGRIVLIRVSDGLELPILPMKGMGQPAWVH